MLNFVIVLGAIIGCVYVVVLEKEFDYKRKGVYYNRNKFAVLEAISGILSVGILMIAAMLI